MMARCGPIRFASMPGGFWSAPGSSPAPTPRNGDGYGPQDHRPRCPCSDDLPLLRRRLRGAGVPRCKRVHGQGRSRSSGEFRAAVLQRLGAGRNAGRQGAADAAHDRGAACKLGSGPVAGCPALCRYHRRAWAGFGGDLWLGADADRGLLCRQQADEGLCRQRQYRHEFAAVHGFIRRRAYPGLWVRHGAGPL